MYIIFLRFSAQKSKASTHMAGHNDWINSGFEDDVFLLSGSLPSGQGGMVLARSNSFQALQSRIKQDPFVIHDVVRAEVIEIAPKRASATLEYLLPNKEAP